MYQFFLESIRQKGVAIKEVMYQHHIFFLSILSSLYKVGLGG